MYGAKDQAEEFPHAERALKQSAYRREPLMTAINKIKFVV
jgi:hypothetical protein